ncbi:MAG: hypothetical protein ACR2IP_13595 [Solirubrobacteraceae bacterium]
MSRNPPGASERPSPAAVKSISAIIGVLFIGVLFQAVSSGIFVREQHHDGLINAHSGIAYLVGLLALAALVVAVVMWRGRAGGQVVVAETAALFIAVVIQIGIGQQVGDLGKTGTHPGLLAVHIPLALIIFGLAVHISAYVASIRRGAR